MGTKGDSVGCTTAGASVGTKGDSVGCTTMGASVGTTGDSVGCTAKGDGVGTGGRVGLPVGSAEGDSVGATGDFVGDGVGSQLLQGPRLMGVVAIRQCAYGQKRRYRHPTASRRRVGGL